MVLLHTRDVLAPAAALLIVVSGRSSAHGFVIPLASSSVELWQFKQQHQRDHRHHHHRHAAVVGAPGRVQDASFLPRLGLTSPRLEVVGPASNGPSVDTAGSIARMSCCSQLGPASAAVGRLGGAIASTVFLRGGGVEHNVLPGVLAELANIRTPAALLGGAALGTMFVGSKPDGNKRLHLVYTVLSTSAFVLQLVCVLCSTLTYTSVASNSEAIAVSAIGYLSENMQFEFYVIRGSFVYGLFSFIGALIARGWLTFGSDGNQNAARVMTVILGSSAIFLLNFLHHTHNQLTLCLGGMTKRLIWLSCRNMYGSKKRLFRHIFWVAATWAAVKVLKLGPNQGSEPELEKSTIPAKTTEKTSD